MANKLTYKDFFYCYSYELQRFLYKRGIEFIITAKHNQSLKQFWLYQPTDELYRALQEYEIRRILADYKVEQVQEVAEGVASGQAETEQVEEQGAEEGVIEQDEPATDNQQ